MLLFVSLASEAEFSDTGLPSSSGLGNSTLLKSNEILTPASTIVWSFGSAISQNCVPKPASFNALPRAAVSALSTKLRPNFSFPSSLYREANPFAKKLSGASSLCEYTLTSNVA